jgi:hypothetical protein
MRNFSDRYCRENQNTPSMFSNFSSIIVPFFLDNVEKYGRANQAKNDDIIWRMRIACWIPKATETHSEYVILIALPQQQWLHELASMLRYTYIAYLVESWY